MPSYNRVMLIGRLTRDPELRYTAGGLAVTTFSLAVDRRFKNQQTGERQTDFFRCKAWRQKAEFVANYLSKGRLVAVDGSIEISEVVGPDGQKKFFTDIVCDNVESLDAPRDGAGGDGDMGHAPAAPGRQGAPGGDDRGDYDPEEDNAPAAPPRAAAPAARAAVPRAAAPAASAAPNGGARPAGAQAASRPAPAGGAAPTARPAATPARAPQPAYPEDDFDDSDPFADE